MVAEDNETSKDKEIDKLMALISLSFKKINKPTNNNLRTSSNTSRANQDNSPRINRGAGYENQRNGNVARARETVEEIDQNDADNDLAKEQRSRLSHINANNGKSKESFNKKSTLLEKRMDESILLDKQCQSSLENFKVKSYVKTIIPGVELCKQTINNRTYIGYIDPVIQSTIESNFCPVISSISAGLNQFHKCLNEEMVADLRYFNSLESEVDSLRSQLETQKT
nr:hypothetical protein [Tanacetum cinerariifolium]